MCCGKNIGWKDRMSQVVPCLQIHTCFMRGESSTKLHCWLTSKGWSSDSELLRSFPQLLLFSFTCSSSCSCRCCGRRCSRLWQNIHIGFSHDMHLNESIC